MLDRYGPFWVATTLIFTSTVSGNYANYLSYKRDEAAAAGAAGAPSPSAAAAPAGDQKVWYYDINKVRRPVGRKPFDMLLRLSSDGFLSREGSNPEVLKDD